MAVWNGYAPVVCPVCGGAVWTAKGMIVGHAASVRVDGRLVSCLGGGMTPEEAQVFIERLIRAPHP